MHDLHAIVWILFGITLSILMLAFTGAFLALAFESFEERSHTIGNTMGRIPSILVTKRW
ncbi:MAG: hypothetical protein NTX72_04490 [Candidatus Uhrbacteria bacterium]|nr:hypothetical protein [Candidatus Uhrbacteria bacterium]